MNRLQGAPQELTSVSDLLTDDDLVLYNFIHSKKDTATCKADMKRETILPDRVVTESLNSLLSKKLIKVVNIKNKRPKHYMASEFEPSSEGSLNTGFINDLKDKCLEYIFEQKVSTHDGVLEWSRNSEVFFSKVTTQQIEEILNILLLDDEIVEVKSTGFEDFASVPKGIICYKCKSKGSVRGEQKHAAYADIPCVVCPRTNQCTIDGIVSPTTCVYYQKWLDF